MTDAEIKKALKCCYIYDTACKECPFIGTPDCGKLVQNTIDLINRQQAEIERLTALLNELEYDLELMRQEKAVVQAETTEQLSKKIESRLANNTDISNVQYQSVIFDISEASK